jgi:hypothetical protein
MYRRIRRIEIQNQIYVVERVLQRKTDGPKYTVVQSSGRVVGFTEVSEQTGRASMQDPSLNLLQGGEID